MKELFRGSAAALVTPFGAGGVNAEMMERLAARQLEGGTDALVVFGTTGEPCTMTQEEKERAKQELEFRRHPEKMSFNQLTAVDDL